MRQRLIYILLFVAGFAPQLAHAYTIDSNQDTIPPIFTVPPSSLTVLCEASDLETTFTNWYQSQAGAEADNGTASVLPTIPLVQAVDSLNNLRSNLCINGNALTLEFFALDSCGNRSNETLSANFSITDTEKPQILSPATDKDLYCTATVSDSLQAWIAVQGGAVVTDECSATSWSNYIWNDNLGNSGFNDFTDSSGIVIHRVDCTWNVTVSFFVEDACGNDNVTTAMFSIIGDTLAPVLQHELRDTFLLCDQMIPVDSPTILDECDGELLVTQVDSTTQSLSPDSCSHYNYEIISTWIGEDACGNNIETSRTITVRDTIAPQISFNSTVALDCSQDISDLSYLLMISDACSQPTISFKDSILFDSNCQDQFLRTWFVSDFCGNVDSVQQTIQIQDFTGPEFLSDPIDLNISCDNSQLSVIFDQWILDNSQGISDGCNGYAIKVLPPGNYTDTLEIQATPELILADLICEKPDSLGVVAELEAYYVAYDLCGNITEKIASFKVTDVEQPNITDCPSDLDIQVNPNQCNADYTLVLPSFTDNCLVAEDAEWVISVNGISLNTIGQQSIPIVSNCQCN